MNKIQLKQLCPTQISNSMIRADFSVFVQRKPQKYSNHIKQKKKVKIPFGRSEKDKQQLTLPGLVYDVNYDSVMPNKRAAIIHNSKPRTKRSITEQDEHINLPRIEMKREKSSTAHFRHIRPQWEYPITYFKLSDQLPMSQDELKDLFKNLLSRHNIQRQRL